MYLIIDNYDSFTYNLADLVAETGRDVEVRPCDAIGPWRNCGDETGRHHPVSRSQRAGRCNLEVPGHRSGFRKDDAHPRHLSRHGSPGLCAGASVIRGKKPMHGKVTTIHHDGRGLFKGLPKTFSVTRYHSLVVKKRPAPGLPRRCYE